MNTLMILCTAVALCGQPKEASRASGDDFGSISGQIQWEGERPAPKPDLVMD